MLFQIPAIIDKYTSKKNRAAQIVIETNENLTDEQRARLTNLVEKYGWFCFLEDTQITEEQIMKIPPLPKLDKDEKSPQQILRGRMYAFWEQKVKQTTQTNADFNLWYAGQLEKLGNQYLDRL